MTAEIRSGARVWVWIGAVVVVAVLIIIVIAIAIVIAGIWVGVIIRIRELIEKVAQFGDFIQPLLNFTAINQEGINRRGVAFNVGKLTRNQFHLVAILVFQ